MRLLTIVIALFMVISFNVFAQSSPPTMYQDGKIMPTGPSLPVGGRNSATNAQGELEFESTTGVNSLWVTTAGASHTQVCDAAGNCAEVEPFSATHAVALQTLLTSAGVYAFDGVTMARLLAIAGADNVAGNTVGLGTASFNYGLDAAGTWDRITLHTAGDALAAGQQGQDVLSYNLFYNGANYRRWLGAAMSSDNLATTTEAPWVGNFNMGFDTVGGNWDRISMHAAGDALSATQMGLDTISFTHFFNGAAERRWQGAAVSADNVATSTEAPWTSNFMYHYDSVGDNWDRTSAHAAGDALGATQMGTDILSYQLFYDGTNYRRWLGSVLSGETVANASYAPHVKNMLYAYDSTSSSWRWINVLDSVTDNLSVAQNSLFTTAVIMGYDGATLDMARLGAVGELQVTDVATRPGEDAANDQMKTKKVDTLVSAPNKETSGAIDTAPAVVILAARDVSSYPNFCIYVKNNDAADPLVSCTIEYSPDSASWTAGVAMSAVCTSLAFGQTCHYCVSGNSDRYIRVSATATDANPVSTVDTWWVGNKN